MPNSSPPSPTIQNPSSQPTEANAAENQAAPADDVIAVARENEAASDSRFGFKSRIRSRLWRPLLSCGGALGLGLALAQVLVKPVAPRAGGGARPQVILPRETTLIVQAQQPPGALLRGELRLVADIEGRAPVGGAVARWLIEPGTRVGRGDAVVEISSGEATRAAPGAEALQNQAEQSQIEAAQGQNALAEKLSSAQTKLSRAQQRVERAQTQVSAARDLVRRLQNGEQVSSSEIPAAFRTPSASEPQSSLVTPPASPASPAPNPAAAIALQQAQAAREAAREGARDLQAARQTLSLAQSNVRATGEKLKATAAQVSEVEARFEDRKASGADVEAARSAALAAQTAVTAAAKALESAQAELLKREKSAATLSQYAEKARADAALLAPAAPNTPLPVATATPRVAPAASRQVSLEDAAKFAQAALDESRRASREAERIHADIDSYQRQVARSRSQITSATQSLASAQQKVLDSVPRPRFTAARAPEAGIVTWISRLAREVGAGQPVFGLARGDKVAARFEDKGQLWRNLKSGQSLPAFLVAPRASARAATESSSPTPEPPLTSPSKAVAAASDAVTVKVTEIQNPSSPGEAALVSAEVSLASPLGSNTSPATAASLRAGMEILASVAPKNEKPTLSVPLSALIQRGTQTYLAVLTPRAAAAPIADAALSRTLAPTAKSSEKSADGEDSEEFQLRWQPVSVGRSDGIRQEITAGLAPGARVVVLPAPLEELGLSPRAATSAGEPATGESSENGAATPQVSSQVSSDVGLLDAEEVMVRLTSSSA